MYKFLILIFLFIHNLHGYESEDKLKAVLVGKVAKYITWKDKSSDRFVITILNNPFENLFNTIYSGKQIQKRDVEIRYIDTIDDLAFTNILYIPKVNSNELIKILKEIENKNILTISDMRSFAQKGGMIQILFSSQQAKLKINLESATKENLQIKASLLNISDVIQGGEE